MLDTIAELVVVVSAVVTSSHGAEELTDAVVAIQFSNAPEVKSAATNVLTAP